MGAGRPPAAPQPRTRLPTQGDPQVGGPVGGRAFASLAGREFRWYWAATVAYYVGFFGDQLARNWLAFEITGSALLLGVVVVSQGVPQALLGVLGGALADRFPKRQLLLAAQMLLAAAALVQCGLLVTGLTQYWHVVLLAVVNGIAVGLSLPGRLSYVGELVSEQEFVGAYGLYYVANSTMRVAGPALGGIMTAAMSVTGAYAMIAAAHLVALALLLGVRAPAPSARNDGGNFLGDLAGTFRFGLSSRPILILMGAELGIVFFAFSSINMMPVFAARVFDVGAGGLGTLLSAVGIGGVAGSLLVTAAGGIDRKPLLLLGAGAAQGVALILFALAPQFTVAVGLALVLGIASSAYTTLNSTMFQLNAPPGMRGRVMSLYMMGQALQPIGVVPVSTLSDTFGVQPAVMAAGGLLVLFMGATAALFADFRRARV